MGAILIPRRSNVKNFQFTQKLLIWCFRMSTNQGGGDFQQGNCQGFRFSNQNEPVHHYVSPQAPQVQMPIMGDSHGDIGTGSFAKFQQFLQWKRRSESMSTNSSLNSSFGQQSTRLSDTSHVPTLTSMPNDSKT